MSIVCTKVEDSICKKVSYGGTSGFIRAKIDPATKHLLNLPSNYKYHSVFLPRKYEQWADRFQNFEVREDDIWICGYPKTGTTWIHNIAWQLKNNLDFSARPRNATDEFFEAPMVHETATGDDKLETIINEYDHRLEEYETMSVPRMFKTHLPAFLLPKQIWTVKPKVIYIARDARDSVISRFHMYRSTAFNYTGTLEKLCDSFMNDQTNYSPFYDHINSFWQLRNIDHVLFITYEELSEDLLGGVKRISEFLDCSYNDEQLKNLADHVSFGAMSKKSPGYVSVEFNEKLFSGHKHCRKGKVGGYRDELNMEWVQKFNEWTKNQIKDRDFSFTGLP